MARQKTLFDKGEVEVRKDKQPRRTPHFVTRCEISPISRELEVDVTLCWNVTKRVTIHVPAPMVPYAIANEDQREELDMDIDRVTQGKLVGPEIHPDGLYITGLVNGEYVTFKMDDSAVETIVLWKERQ